MRPAVHVVTIIMFSSLLCSDPVRSSINESNDQPGPYFEVTLDEHPDVVMPTSGRLFLLLSKNSQREPRLGPSWFKPEPFFGLDVKQWSPGESITVNDRFDGFPCKPSKLPPGRYYAQAVLHRNPDQPKPGTSPGNLYSRVVTVDISNADSKESTSPVELVLDERVPDLPLINEPLRKEIGITSPMLSRFHERPVEHRAMVVLPPSYHEQPLRRYPVIYVIPGFGGDHRQDHWKMLSGPREPLENQTEFIRVQLTGMCEWGHHVFTNSATNGPRGDALIKELIPHVDRQFRTVSDRDARFLTGHSSGGWAVLWLQVNYPETFGGVWSIAPDPVDFRDFQQIDLYAYPPLNMFRDENGEPRPIGRVRNVPVLWYEKFSAMDDCLRRGGQLRSFEAVFSPLDEKGQPMRLWDRTTGQIDPAVAESWQAYDIRLLLEANWPKLEPLLAGRLNVMVGADDTFYLEGAVRQLKVALAEMGSDARVEIFAGFNHGSILNRKLIDRNIKEMGEIFRRRHPEAAPENQKPIEHKTMFVPIG